MDVRRAVAYLKATLPLNEHTPGEISLDGGDALALTEHDDVLATCYLVDCGSAWGYIQVRHLEEAKLSLAELHSIAIGNLWSIAEAITIREKDGVFYFLGSGDFEASLILVDFVWDKMLKDACPNGYFAALPARDLLAVCDHKNAAALEKLRAVADTFNNPSIDHKLTSLLYERPTGAKRFTACR